MDVKHFPLTRFPVRTAIAGVLLVLLMLAITGLVRADSSRSKTGAVMARSVVVDPSTGQPILVEYNEDGSEAGVVALPAAYQSNVGSLSVMAGSEYQSHKDRLDLYLDQYAEGLASGAQLMDRNQFLTSTFVAADGQTSITRPPLDATVKSVLVRAQGLRSRPSSQDLILLSFPVNLAQNYPADNARSLLLDADGNVIASSTHTIGYRVGFFGDASAPQEALSSRTRRAGDPIFGPVPGIKVSVSDAYPGGVGATDNEGRYSFRYYLPTCPLGGFEFTTDVYAELPYQSFLPLGSPMSTYYLRRQDWDTCYASLVPGPLGLVPTYQEAELSDPIVNVDFYVDVLFLTGKVGLENLNGEEVALGDDTQYRAFTEAEELQRTITYYDFNADGTPDTVVHGTVKDVIQTDGSTVNRFVAENTPQLWTAADTVDWQGVYFRAEDAATQAPDLLRRADTQKRLDQSIGLLTQISQEDYRNTDILIFRESTGQLILHRRGLSDAEIQGRPQTGFDETDNRFAYRVMLRGPRDSDLNIGGGNRSGGYSQFASTLKMAAPFQHREADHPKPGETVRVVAINRATGYLGTARTPLTSAAGNAMASVEVPEITMRPPNLKIWAERISTVEQGMTQGEERHHVIGSEGAGLTSDTTITLYTEWLDSDGSALPTELGLDGGEQFGLTGRLAKIVAPNTLAATAIGSSSLAEFPIAPGRRTQALQIGSNLSQAEHFYIHVVGTPKDADPPPNFAIGDAVAPYDSRPRRFTPFLVPLFDEASTMADYNAYRQLQASDTPPEDLKNPPPTYVWQFRPEYQFSQFDLDMRALERVTGLGTPQEERTDILNTQTPVIASSDDLIQALYSLIGNQFDRLSPIDGKQELLLALGETETLVELGQDKTLRFSNLQSLASLNPEDFLTMRLYTNNDAGNVLWEWAFEHLVLDTQLAGYDINAGEPLYVSADDPVVPVQALVLGYAKRDPAIKEPIAVQWAASGPGLLERYGDENHDLGNFFNEVTLPSSAGAQTRVSLQFVGEASSKVTLPAFIVVPGKPTTITASTDGLPVHVDGVGESTWTFRIQDAHGNAVADGTGVSFFPEESLQVVRSDGATTQGLARVTLKGGPHSGPAKLKLQVGDIAQVVDVNVQPLSIAIAADPTVFAGTQGEVSLTVTDSTGQPVKDASLKLGSTYGYLQDTQVTTDANGQARTRYTAPDSDGQGELSAQVGRSSFAKTSVSVVYPQGQDRDLEVKHAMVVGDRDSAGAITHTRYDAAQINVAYPTQAPITVMGTPGSQVTVHIGDLRDPNRSPIGAYYMNGVYEAQVEDDSGRKALQAYGVTQANGTPLGGGTSLRFATDANASEPGDQPSLLFADGVTHLQRGDQTGFAVDVFPIGALQGELVNLGQGAQRLTFSNDNRLVFEIRTNEGSFSVTSEPLMPMRWHTVATRYASGVLTLWVNGQSTTTPASGALDYNGTGLSDPVQQGDPTLEHDLMVGKGFSGQLNSLKWFDWASEPVLTFADGSTETTVTLPAALPGDSLARQTLTLRSTGQLHTGGSQLGLMRVAIHTDKVRQYASLVSTEGFTAMAGFMVDSLATDTPPLNLAALGLSPGPSTAMGQSLPLSFLIPSAQAADGESGFLMDVINWVLPLESFATVFEQLGYLVSDPDKFEADEFVIALVDAITIFPPAKPLKLFTAPLKAMTRAMKVINPKFAKHFGGFINKVMQKAKKGDFDTLWNMLPFLVLAAEMYNDEEARKGLEFLISTVDSADDVVAWVDYLALPADGWEGEGDPPQVDAFGSNPQAALPLSFMFRQAQAAPSARRVVARVLGETLASVSRHLDDSAAKALPEALAAIKQGLRGTLNPSTRRYVFKKELMGISAGMMARAGAKTVRNLVRGIRNARYHPAVLISFLAYLEYENACGRAMQAESETQTNPDPGQTGPSESERLNCSGNGFPRSIRSSIYTKMRAAFSDIAADGQVKEAAPSDSPPERYQGDAHGALFHLEQLAFYQASHRLSDSFPAIKAVDGFRYVGLFDRADKIPNVVDGVGTLDGDIFRRIRYIDIILQGQGNEEEWIELKSYMAKSPTQRDILAAGKIKTWTLSASGSDSGNTKDPTSLHRQFVIDRAAKSLQKAWLAKNQSQDNRINQVVVPTSFLWKFQKFHVRRNNPHYEAVSPNLGSRSQRTSIRGQFAEDPNLGSFSKPVLQVSLGADPNTNHTVVDSGISATIKTVLPQLGFTLLSNYLEEFELD